MQVEIQEATERKIIIPTFMRAAQITAPQKVEWKKVTVPQIQPDEVLVKLQGCGLCASNIPVWEGREWFQYPMPPGSPGHEGWGVVASIGDKVKSVKIGDHVAMISANAYAEFDIAKQNHLIKIPPALQSRPFPGEPLGCAMNIFRRSNIRKGDTVAIVGIGFLGALLVQLAKNTGAKVIAISRRKLALDLAAGYGADEVIEMHDHWDIIEKAKAITNGELCKVVIEATGKQWPLHLAGELTAERGRLVIAGYHQDGVREVNMQLWNWRGIDVINAHERAPEKYVEGMKEAAKAILNKTLDPYGLYTHRFSLEEMNEAFGMLADHPNDYVKGLVIMNE